MMRAWTVLSLTIVVQACAPKPQGIDHPPMIAEGASPVLTDADVRIIATVDTVPIANREAIACLRRFLTTKLTAPDLHATWYGPDLQRFGTPYSELYYAEYDSVGDLRYFPRVTAIHPVEEGRLLRVAWSADSGGGTAAPQYVFDFLAVRTDEGVRLSLPIDRNTRTWGRRGSGELTYIISPRHTFNEEQAREQSEVLDRLADFFDVPPFPIIYYSFADPVDLFTAKGFHVHPLMHIPSGGMVDEGDHVYSGNNKDIYTHEVVHLFTRRKWSERPDLLEEGLATWIGGSVEQDYAWHRANLQRYLEADPSIDLRDRCNPYVRDDIFQDTRVPYVIGAVLCEHLVRREGKQGLFSVMASGPDPWPTLAVHGITRENLTDVIREELRSTPITMW